MFIYFQLLFTTAAKYIFAIFFCLGRAAHSGTPDLYILAQNFKQEIKYKARDQAFIVSSTNLQRIPPLTTPEEKLAATTWQPASAEFCMVVCDYWYHMVLRAGLFLFFFLKYSIILSSHYLCSERYLQPVFF
jgi:hypothetical protein